jgi:flagellar M-ring protein FliF
MDFDGLLQKLSSGGKAVSEGWTGWSAGKKVRTVLVVVIIIAVSAVTVLLLNRTSYDVLYTNLSSEDAGLIMAKLAEMQIDAKPRGTDTILIPAGQVDLTRMELAAQGFPKNSANLDILQKGTGFGVTEEDKEIYRRYQLQEDLQNAIKTFGSIEDAKVSLFVPKESVFVIENQVSQATAAVLIHIRQGESLSPANVRAIAELVQKSVPNLKMDNISIIDSDMNLLSAEEESNGLSSMDQIEMQQYVSDRLRKQVTDLLSPIFGIGSTVAQVNAVLDFDDRVVDSIRFEPMEGASEGIISSIDQIREISKTTTGETAEGEPGTGTNGGVTTYPVVDTEDTVYEKNSEQIIYEINTIKEHLVKAKGTVKSLSVSVVLDSNTANGIDYSETVKSLVANAIGVSAEFITVESMPFNGVKQLDETWNEYNELVKKAQQWEFLEFVILISAGSFFLLILLIILLRWGKRKSKQQQIEEMIPSFKKNKQLNIDIGDHTRTNREVRQENFVETERTIVEKNIEENPELAVTIIRSWLAEDED